MDFVPGKHFFEVGVEAARDLGYAVASFHGRSVAPLRGCLDEPHWTSYFRDRLVSQFNVAESSAPRPLVARLRVLLDKIYELGQSQAALLEGPGRCLVHGDLIPLNMMHGEQGCLFIDWELGRLDYPEWDLCALVKSLRFDTDSYATFRKCYGREVNEKRLRLVSLLHYANVALWRMAAFYGRGEYRDGSTLFLGELEEEVSWLEENSSSK